MERNQSEWQYCTIEKDNCAFLCEIVKNILQKLTSRINMRLLHLDDDDDGECDDGTLKAIQQRRQQQRQDEFQAENYR